LRVGHLAVLLLVSPLLHAADQEVMPGTDDKWRHSGRPISNSTRATAGSVAELLHNLELLRGVFMEDFKLVERRGWM